MRYCLRYLTPLLLTAPVVARPQSLVDTSHVRGKLVGDLVDTSSGLPLRRGLVCRIGGQCRGADSLGHFEYPWLSPGEQVFTVLCDTGRLFPRELDTLRVRLQPGQHLELRFGVNATGCDQRPFAVEVGEFRGHYTSGFEESSFVSCGDTAVFRTWVDLAGKAQQQERPRWPGAVRGESYQRVYVRWRGTLVGPFHYGHFGVASYHLQVDSILEVRRSSRHDCTFDRE